jgi:hypothetical protein
LETNIGNKNHLKSTNNDWVIPRVSRGWSFFHFCVEPSHPFRIKDTRKFRGVDTIGWNCERCRGRRNSWVSPITNDIISRQLRLAPEVLYFSLAYARVIYQTLQKT